MAETTVSSNNALVRFRGKPQREFTDYVEAKKLKKRGMISDKAMKKAAEKRR